MQTHANATRTNTNTTPTNTLCFGTCSGDGGGCRGPVRRRGDVCGLGSHIEDPYVTDHAQLLPTGKVFILFYLYFLGIASEIGGAHWVHLSARRSVREHIDVHIGAST